MKHHALAAGLVALSALFAAPAAAQQDIYDRINRAAPLKWRGQKFLPVAFFSAKQSESAAEAIARTVRAHFHLRIRYDEETISGIDRSFRENASATPFVLRAFLSSDVLKLGQVCIAQKQETIKDLREDVRSFFGLGNDAVRHPRHPFDYSFQLPRDITPQAWQSFKTHFTAGLCLRPPRAGLYDDKNPFREKFNTGIFTLAFAALMAARDGYPQIMPFIADMHAATFLNTSIYNAMRFRVALLAPSPPAWKDPGVKSFDEMPYLFETYPSLALDDLNRQWLEAEGRWQTMAAEDIPEALDALADKHSFNRLQYWTYNALRTGQKTGDGWDESFARTLEARGQEGAERLNLCISPSIHVYNLRPGDLRGAPKESAMPAAWAPPRCPRSFTEAPAAARFQAQVSAHP